MRPFLLVGLAFCLNALTVGPMKSLGVFFLQFQSNLNASAGEASLVTSLLYGAFFLSGPIASVLANRFGYRETIIFGSALASLGAIACTFSQNMITVDVTLGILTGTGCGLATVPTMAMMGIKFKERRSFVNNIVTMGSALAAIPLSPLVQFWIDSYGWRGAVLVLGGIILNSIPTAMAMITAKTNSELVPNKKRKLIDVDLLKTFTFPTYALACGCQMASMVSITVYLVRFAQELDLGDYQAASLSSIISIVDVCLRPISGYITTLTHIGRIPIRRSYFFCGVMCVQAAVVAVYPFATSLHSIIAVTVAYACSIGSIGALPITILSDLFGTDKLVSSLGLRAMVVGLSSMVTPPLIGRLVDATGSYHFPFYASSILALTAAILVAVVQTILLRRESLAARTKADSDVEQIEENTE